MKQKMCDPAVCDNCIYIGEGDFICDRSVVPEMVVSDWQPTDKYLMCQKIVRLACRKKRKEDA